MNSIVAALRFFFTHALNRSELARKLVRTAHASKIPVVLTHAEVKRLLDATTSLKHQAALSIAYGAGLRVSEVSALKVSDIDSKRMLLRSECLNAHWFLSLQDACEKLEACRRHYNEERPHSAIGNIPPDHDGELIQ